MTQNPIRIGDDFVSSYMRLCDIDNSEAPAIYHRWVCLSILGAYMGRKVWIDFGIGPIYPNQYIMLMGSPGTRKGAAMAVGRKLLKASGFSRFSADKTSKERFLMDMKQFDLSSNGPMVDDIEELAFGEPAESYVMAGEFTDFIGQGNMEFITLLTNLWDNLDDYKHPKIQGKSVEVFKPTVNMIGANTPDGFALAFPPEALGNGFLSRVILLHAEPTSNKIAWPSPPDKLAQSMLVNRMIEVKDEIKGEIIVSTEAKLIGKEIYEKEIPVEDPRFIHYQQRRFTHLLKISMILAVFDKSHKILPLHIKRANTVLVMAERHMPRALGEFGASKYSSVAGKLLSHLANCQKPQTPAELFRVISRDIGKMSELVDILQNLKHSEKIQAVNVGGKSGYLPLHKPKKEWPAHLLDLSWLTEQELI